MIQVVGNILKDVYLSLDSRSESLETDKFGTEWLNLAFDSSDHHFFRRTSSFGGAAVTLEVLKNLGLPCSISGSNFSLSDAPFGPAPDYRYILTSGDNVTYFTSTKSVSTSFVPTDTPVDYLYIDRSANLDYGTTIKIAAFLRLHPETKLIVYLKNTASHTLNTLANHADLVFLEEPAKAKNAVISHAPESLNLDPKKTVKIAEDSLKYLDITEPLNVGRIDTLTHLSAFSITAATVLGSFILKNTVEKSFQMARVNVEDATLSSSLTLSEINNHLESPLETASLELIAASLVASQKGILAADESGGSIHKKFDQLGIPDTFENRHAYRNIFFTTPDIERCLTGIILFDETARDFMDTGESVPDYLISHRIIPGIKVDQGLAHHGDSEETYTKGLDDLPRRLQEYYGLGLRFAKWRAAFTLTKSENGHILTPTDKNIEENCKILAEYALECQKAGLVPIVEPELIYDGNYTLDDSTSVTGKILRALFSALKAKNVSLRACILKTNMVLAGKKSARRSTPEEVGRATATVLKQNVPSNLAGIVFLSGGQTPEQATDNLAAIIKNGPFPWPVTFSFARALQDPALYAWNGDNKNTEKARQAFLDRLIAVKNSL